MCGVFTRLAYVPKKHTRSHLQNGQICLYFQRLTSLLTDNSVGPCPRPVHVAHKNLEVRWSEGLTKGKTPAILEGKDLA